MNTYISASAWPSHLLCPSLNHKKSVTFHTNKARPHHLLCIVRTFLLELCFWILTVTVPDPGLNGNLASGPFGFLIEYPCAITCPISERIQVPAMIRALIHEDNCLINLFSWRLVLFQKLCELQVILCKARHVNLRRTGVIVLFCP